MSDAGGGWTPPEPPTSPGSGGAGEPDPRWTPPLDAPRPGIIPLRPLGVGEILEGAFRLIRRHAGTVIVLAAVLALLQAVASTAAIVGVSGSLSRAAEILDWQPGEVGSSGQVSPEDLRALMGELSVVAQALGLATVVGFLVSLLGAGLFTVLTGRAVLGRSTTVGRAWREALPRLLPLAGVTLLYAVFLIGYVVVAAVVIGVASAAGGAGASLAVLLAVAAFVGAMWVAFRLALANTAVVLEKASPMTAVRRSFQLTAGSWGRVAGVIILTSIVASIAGSIIAVPLVELGTIADGSLDPTAGAVVGANFMATFVQSLVSLPFVSTVISLLYIDLRMRKEGLATTLIAASQEPDD